MESIFEKIMSKATSSESDAFSYFGLKDIRVETFPMLHQFFENYEETLERIMSHIFSLSKDKRTIRLALIGPSGSGKTTLLQYLLLNVEEARRDPKYSEKLSNINFILGFYAKDAPKELVEQQYDALKRGNGGILIIDDLHEILLKQNEELFNKFMDMLTDETKNNVIITTWLPYGWAYTKSKYPNIKYAFDEIIFIEGLSQSNCKNLIDKRFKHFSKHDTESSEISHKPFTKEGIDEIIKLGCPNPKIIISLISESLEHAYEKKSQEIHSTDVKEAANSLGFSSVREFYNVSEVKQAILKSMLFTTSWGLGELSKITSQEKPNLSKYLAELTDLGLVTRHQSDRTVIFHMNHFLRYELEKQVMKEL